MMNDDLNTPNWSDKILALPKKEQVEAIKNKIVDGKIDSDLIVLTSIVRHAKLFAKLLRSLEIADAAAMSACTELHRRQNDATGAH